MKRAKLQKQKLVIVVSAALFVLLAAIVTAMILGSQKNEDPYLKPATVINEDEAGEDEPQPTTTEEQTPEPEVADDTADSLDPATVSVIDIQPMDITVSYVQGIGGFEYEVLRSPRGTQYVELRSSELVGTKCTDDEGTFVSIIESPDSAESSTLEKTTEVDGTQYGLALSANTCTNETDLLETYQNSFSDAFSLLKKME